MSAYSQHLWKSDHLHIVCVQMSCEEFSRVTIKKKKIFGNQTVVFGTAWKCENTFVVLPHKLMLFTFMCDSQSFTKRRKEEHSLTSLSVRLGRARSPGLLSNLVQQTDKHTTTNKGLKFDCQTVFHPIFNNYLWKIVIWCKLVCWMTELAQTFLSLDHPAMTLVCH